MTIDYGFDTSCRDDLAPGRTVEGPELVAEAIYRRITTRKGSVRDAPNDGVDVRDWLQADVTEGELATIPGRLRAEIEKDDRVAAGTLAFDLQQTRDGAAVTFSLTVKGLTSRREPFRLVMGIDALNDEGGVELLEVST